MAVDVTSNMLKFAVIGAGHLGSIHARVLDENPRVQLSMICDVDKERGAALASKYGAQFCADVSGLEGIDAAIVATPTAQHFAVAIRLLESGIHVLVEKPICDTVEDARKLCEKAKECNLRLMVGHSERFNPVIVALEAHQLKPRFIDSQRVSPFSFRSADIGVVMDMMIHDIDIILHLTKSPVKAVHAVGVPVIGTNEDLANARLVFENGAVANATASRVALKTERILRMFSREMYVTLDFSKKVGRIIRRGKALEAGGLDLSSPEFQRITNPLEFMQKDLVRIEELKIVEVEPLFAEDDAFLQSIIDEVEPPVSGEDGLRALETAQMIVDSAQASLSNVNLND
ncbi:MAG: putative dehydrogenase [Planctomycetota bacterium]|jgi:predicted dehydrogenase